MCDFDGERPEVWRTATHTARKAYRCGECRRTIEPGERYIRDFTAFEGNAFTDLACGHCGVARDWLIENCGGFSSGLVGLMVEHAQEYPGIGWGLLRVGAGIARGWRRFDGAGLMPVPDMPESIESTMVEA